MAAFWLVQVANPAREIGSASSELFDYLKLILVLGAILALAFVGLRFWLPRASGLRQLSSGPIRIEARYPLEPRKNLYIVRAGSNYFLVGTSESGIHYLTALDAERVEPALAAEDKTKAEPEFARMIRAFRRSSR
jgi:flagellar biogenesis protein FliO